MVINLMAEPWTLVFGAELRGTQFTIFATLITFRERQVLRQRLRLSVKASLRCAVGKSLAANGRRYSNAADEVYKTHEILRTRMPLGGSVRLNDFENQNHSLTDPILSIVVFNFTTYVDIFNICPKLLILQAIHVFGFVWCIYIQQ